MDFKATDFEKLTFNVFRLDTTTKPLFEYFPILETYFKEFKLVELDISLVLKYVIFMYDSRTPLQFIDNVFKRKAEAMRLSGIPCSETGEFDEEYVNSFDGFNTDINKIIIKYCRIQRSHDFSELVFYDNMFYAEMRNVQSETDASKRAKILEIISKAKEQVNKLKELTLLGDNTPRLVNYLLSEVEDETLGLSPEEIAEKMASGFDPLNNYSPYE
jgi:hypothetical protein